MNRPIRSLLVLSCVVSAGTIFSASAGTPQIIRVACGILSVLVLPGFALATAVRPSGDLLPHDVLASVGLSLAISTGVAVLLAALPIGLTRSSFGLSLGVLTIVLSLVAALRQSSGTVQHNAEARGT